MVLPVESVQMACDILPRRVCLETFAPSSLFALAVKCEMMRWEVDWVGRWIWVLTNPWPTVDRVR